MNKRTAFIGSLIALLVVTGLWFFKNYEAKTSALSTLSLSLDNTVESLDPAKAYSDDSLVVASQVLEPLYQYHYLKRPYEIVSLLAEGLPQFSSDGLVLKIKLKKNVYYHPHAAFKGARRELKAEDFVNQFKRLGMESLKSPGRSLFHQLVMGFSEYGKDIQEDWRNIPKVPLKGVVATDDYNLEIRLLKPEPNIIYYLALNFIVPIPWELIEAQENDLDKVLVGTGPYVYKGEIDNYLEMKKFKEYREEFYPSSGDRYANVQKLLASSKERLPFIDTVHFFVTKESERWEKFLRHEIDLMTVPKAFLQRLYDQDGNLAQELREREINLRHFPILASRWFAFNMKDPILGKNENLRRAIAFSIDYTKYLQVISQNTNLRANSVLVPGIAGYRPAQDLRFRYDPELAKKYLKLAGFDKPETMPTITYSTRGLDGINNQEAEFVKTHLEAIGLKVKIDVLPFPEFLKKGRAGELMFFTDVWLFDYPDGENILQLLVSTNSPGINKAGYANPEIDSLYEKLKESSEAEAREAIIHQMEEIIFDDLPWVPLMYESSFVLQYPAIKNFRKSSIIRNYVKYLKIER